MGMHVVLFHYPHALCILLLSERSFIDGVERVMIKWLRRRSLRSLLNTLCRTLIVAGIERCRLAGKCERNMEVSGWFNSCI